MNIITSHLYDRHQHQLPRMPIMSNHYVKWDSNMKSYNRRTFYIMINN